MSDQEFLNFMLNGCQKFRTTGKSKESWIIFKSTLEYLNLNLDNIKIPKGTSSDIIYKLLEEFTIFSYYINQQDKGLLISDKLLFNYETNIKGINKDQLTRNQRFYMKPLHRKNRVKFNFKCEEYFSEMNPSIISNRSGYTVCLRTSNFGVRPEGEYYCRSPDNIVDTKNYILELTKDFKVKSIIPIIDKSTCKQYSVRPIKGLEDLIIFEHQGDLYGSCTCVDTDPYGIPQIGLCKLDFSKDNHSIPSQQEPGNSAVGRYRESDDPGHTARYEINVKRPIKLLDPRRPEKNWLPFVHNDRIHFVYGYSPTQIRAPVGSIADICKGNGIIESELIISNDTDLSFDRFRGSAGPMLIEISNGQRGYLIVVHEVIFMGNSRIYTHRFVLMDSSFKIIKISGPWFLEALQIEFIRGGCIKGNDIILTAGIKDTEAWIYVLDKDTVLNSLIDVEEFKL